MLNTSEISDLARDERLQLRVPSAEKSLFQQAASLTGRSLSDFVIDSTHDAAVKIVKEHDIIRLSREEQAAFVGALLSSGKPGKRLQQAVQSYRHKARV